MKARNKTGYGGYYGINEADKLSADQQHKKAFEHLSHLFKHIITDDDIRVGIEQGYTPAQILYKYWNQENKATNFLRNGDTSTLGNNIPIDIAGWNMTSDIDYSDLVQKAITTPYYVVKKGDNFDTIQRRARYQGRSYNLKGNDLIPYNNGANGIFVQDKNNPEKYNLKTIHEGDTIWFAPRPAEKSLGGQIDHERIADLARRIIEIGYYREGGKIRIKPQNRGKFTAKADRAGYGVQEYARHVLANKEDYPTSTVKQAAFAKAAKGWKHGDGGALIQKYGVDAVRKALDQFKQKRQLGLGGDTTEEEEYFGVLPAAGISVALPGIQTNEGKRIAKNIATRVASGQTLLQEVPRKYQSYVQGEVEGAMPMTRYMNETAPKVALGALAIPGAVIGAAELGAFAPKYLYPAIDSFVESNAGRSIGHALDVMSNPAVATTEAGALASTAADVSGLLAGINGLGNSIDKAARGDFSNRDIPHTLMDIAVLIPGGSAVSNPKNIGQLVETGNTLANISKITSKSTLLNRVSHPIETFRMSELAKRMPDILPSDINSQFMNDLSRTIFYNKPLGIKGYTAITRKPADMMLGIRAGWDQGTHSWIDPAEIWGLGDRTAKSDFSRAHELGHLVKVAADKKGYKIANFPLKGYKYGKQTVLSAENPETIIEENFADIIGNLISTDMPLESIQEISIDRYPNVKNKFPLFIKR